MMDLRRRLELAGNPPRPRFDPEYEDLIAGLTPAQAEAYHDARLRGLCHEGALEVAKGRS
ncbi:MAG: hypothetical protein IT369_05790 [Candidatus Latescibacteria bacterium]|nr:hypothetical protein [Candidatus Latescibacterota bacterium]